MSVQDCGSACGKGGFKPPLRSVSLPGYPNGSSLFLFHIDQLRKRKLLGSSIVPRAFRVINDCLVPKVVRPARWTIHEVQSLPSC